MPQLKDSISFRIPDKAEDSQPLSKCPKKLPAILQLNSERLLTPGFRGLPLVNRSGDLNQLFDHQRIGRMAFKIGSNMRRIQPPLRDQPVRRKPPLQSR